MCNSRRFWTAVGAAALALTPTPGTAQDLETACDAIGNDAVGARTEQRVESTSEVVDYRFALVTSRGATWYEIKAANPQGTSILQLEVPGFPFRPDQIRSAVMKTGAAPAVTIPDALLRQYQGTAQSGPLSDLEALCRTAEVIGSEDVTVAGGSFQTTHLRFPVNGNNMWVTGDVPFGIVRGEIEGLGTLELLSFGSDATGSIAETPLSLPNWGN